MTEFPNTLRSWRKARRFSQLDLAMEADVSSRHISFLETGRARPSPEMITRLGDALDLPLAARNQMLAHAGFAARYPKRDWDDVAMRPIRMAVEHMLQNHAPYPAIAIDRSWTIVKANTPAQAIFGLLGVREGDSLLDILCDPATPDKVENWQEVAHYTIQRLRTESAALGGIAEFDDVIEHLSRECDPAEYHVMRKEAGPVIPTVFKAGDSRLALFTTIAQFGTPDDLVLDDLKIELYFPANEESRELLLAMAQ